MHKGGKPPAKPLRPPNARKRFFRNWRLNFRLNLLHKIGANRFRDSGYQRSPCSALWPLLAEQYARRRHRETNAPSASARSQKTAKVQSIFQWTEPSLTCQRSLLEFGVSTRPKRPHPTSPRAYALDIAAAKVFIAHRAQCEAVLRTRIEQLVFNGRCFRQDAKPAKRIGLFVFASYICGKL